MRRALVALSIFAAVSLAAGLGFRLSSRTAAEQENSAAAESTTVAATTPLPIAQVVLFSSGVGYFQREGAIQGNARIDLTFPVSDINDLLKSMVLEDQGGGHISAVSYDSQAPVEKTLRSFAINLTSNPSFGQLLNQARGEKVELALQLGASGHPAMLTGIVMGIEQKKEVNGKETIEGEFINLWCAEGLRSVKLSDVQKVRFLNPVLDGEVKKALEVLALSHDTQKKAVSLSFAGEGTRTVKVGYVVENPIWKTSYRLVLDKKGKPYLQGWAIVENTQDEDWNNVRMALISGRPISFQMDLYQPLFVARPVVEPELFASLRPPTYNGAMAGERFMVPAFEGGAQGQPVPTASTAATAPADSAIAYRGLLDSDGSISGALGFGGKASRGTGSAAVATALGDFFQYQIDHPVNLPRQKSALLPIVNEEVEGTRVSIYNEATHAKFPLLGLRFKNTTKLHLMQGPITVFDNNTYAGDARILDLQPKEERLLSYAIDLGVEVEPAVLEPNDRFIQIKIVKGIVNSTIKSRSSKRYVIKNRTEHERTVLIEHPYRAEFKLVEPQADERARDVYRFEVAVAAGKTAQREVVEEKETDSKIAIGSMDDDAVRLIVSQSVTSDAVKEALAQASALQSKLYATNQEIAKKEKRLKEISEDQARLRANLKEVPTTSEAYKRYVKKFDAQESEIEQLQDEMKKLQEQEHKERKHYEKFIADLNVE